MAEWELPDDWTLGEARDWLRARVEKGSKCPCCTRFAKVYTRPLNSNMGHALIVMYKHAGTDWFHLPDIERRWRSHDHACLQYWDFIEELQEKRLDGGKAGWWRVTEQGEKFVLKQSMTEKYARIYDKRLLGRIGEQVGIADALGTQFNYQELMEN